MNASSFIGHVGGLAVALGVGAAVFVGNGTACADSPNSSSTSTDGSETSGTSDSPKKPGPLKKPKKPKDSSATEQTSTTANAEDAQAPKAPGKKRSLKPLRGVLGAHESSSGPVAQSALETGAAAASQTSPERRTPVRKRDRSSWKPTRAIPSSPASSPAGTSGDTGAPNDVVVMTLSPATAPPITGFMVGEKVRAASTRPWVPTLQVSQVSPSPMVPVQRATPNEAKPAPRFLTALATAVSEMLHPVAGNTPAAPAVDPIPMLLFAAARERREISDAAVASNPASPTLTVNGYTITPDAPVTLTGIYNMKTAPPGVNETVQGYQQFDTVDANGNPGTLYAYVSTAPYLGPRLPNADSEFSSSQVLYVDSGIADLLGHSPSTGALPDGTVISRTSSFGGTFVNVYSAIPSTTPGGADTVTDTFTIIGRSIDLSWLVKALGFNAARVTPALPDYIRGVGDPTITSINGLPPLTIAAQGYQTFEYLDADGNPVGQFNAVVTTTTDAINFHTEAFLVTGYPDAGRGDAPAIGTVFNTVNLFDLSNVYSSIPQADGTTKITNILTNTSTGSEYRPLLAVPGRRQRLRGPHRRYERPGIRFRRRLSRHPPGFPGCIQRRKWASAWECIHSGNSGIRRCGRQRRTRRDCPCRCDHHSDYVVDQRRPSAARH